jgi:hypothetical protein
MALMFDIQMLKTIFRSLARMDGVVPFQTAKPRLASAWMAPYADQYVASIRKDVSSADMMTQGQAALWAGTARTAMMIPAGLVDFFGPIAEENLGEAAVRMGQDTVNAAFSLTTRLATIMVGPPSELPAFDHTLAQTEWLLSAAPYLYGAKSLMGRGPASPMRASVLKSAVAGVGTVADFGINLKGLMLKASDDEVVAALVKHSGNRSKAAAELRVASSRVSERVTKASEDSPLAKFKKVKGKGGKLLVTDDQIVAALARHNGVRFRAAAELKVQPSAIDHRVWNAAEGSPLAIYKVKKGEPHRGRQWVKVSDADLLAALERHQGNRLQAGKEVGLSISAVSSRIKLVDPNSPFAKYKTLKGKAPSTKGKGWKATDEQLFAALQDHHGNCQLAAKDLRMSSSAIYLRIKQAGLDSPLNGYKTLDGRRGPRVKVGARVASVAPSEPLAVAKQVKHKVEGVQTQGAQQTAPAAPPPDLPLPHLDDAAITRALIANRRDWFKTALQLRCGPGAIAKRIAMASESSPLHEFKNKRRNIF